MKKIKPIVAVILVAVGIFLVFWALNHSPEADIVSRISDALEGERALTKTSYYSMLVGGALLILIGGVRLVKSF